MVVTWLAWCSVPGNTRLEDQLRLERLSSVTVSRVSKLCSFRTARSSRLPGPSRSLLHRHDISSNLFAMVSVWLRRCAWRCQTSNNLMYLFLSRSSLDVNANGVRATASGGVPAKASSRSPKATCCAITLAFTACSACLVASWNAPFREVLASPNTHTSRPPIISVPWHCLTCITLSSIASICSGARCTRTVQLLNNLTVGPAHNPIPQGDQPSTPKFGRASRQLTQHCRPFVLHGLDIVDFERARYSLDTSTLSPVTVLT